MVANDVAPRMVALLHSAQSAAPVAIQAAMAALDAQAQQRVATYMQGQIPTE